MKLLVMQTAQRMFCGLGGPLIHLLADAVPRPQVFQHAVRIRSSDDELAVIVPHVIAGLMARRRPPLLTLLLAAASAAAALSATA
eukprot:CAMPEP_0115720392 /NCGR_PEP_ID=MMETSP0272-20121206/78514_1 /TAXON_ID=71861 /ORGANISM="Scrippsiella trochoidea, Strain CCMP3099" /LENGTH=84 /DNA_ID=CAMNT_0003163133 /DNA_START=141 /DNA_END=392 /DNA_ORIENTATION=-